VCVCVCVCVCAVVCVLSGVPARRMRAEGRGLVPAAGNTLSIRRHHRNRSRSATLASPSA
jgi:hypothetical protein